jgi:hypothetical protein
MLSVRFGADRPQKVRREEQMAERGRRALLISFHNALWLRLFRAVSIFFYHFLPISTFRITLNGKKQYL